MTELMIEAEGLVKGYRQVSVLNGLDLAVPRGSIFALLGPNGAGKTTTVRILATLADADAGRAVVAGYDVRRQRQQVRRRISLTGQYAAVDDAQTGRENLVMMGRLSGLGRAAAGERADDLLARFELDADGGRRVGGYSGGMRRRLDLAAGLVARPEVIFLDEPTTGLDPRSRQQGWELIAGLAEAGTTVLLTTQYLEEADRLADKVAVLDGGSIVAEGTPAQLKARFAEQRLELVAATAAGFAELVDRFGRRSVRTEPDRRALALATDGSAAGIRRLLDEVDPEATLLASFAVHTATLDDVFLALTGHPTGTELNGAELNGTELSGTELSGTELKENSHV